MSTARGDSRKYIIGWLTLKPGQGQAFVPRAREYASACRREEGCVFFEMNQSADNPDVFVVSECFASPEAHEAHLRRDPFVGMWKQLDELAIGGRFENIFADSVAVDTVTFPSTSST